MSITEFEPRQYQQQILNLTKVFSSHGSNVLIELDCGLGKRFLQLSFINETFSDKKILLILQSSTSLYETHEYIEKHSQDMDIKLIDSRIPSKLRAQFLKEHQIILVLPQTLKNTLKKYPNALDDFDLVMINEVDQIVKRMGISNSYKFPYPKLMPFFDNKLIIGMSGTIRDSHYVLDKEQMEIKKELESLLDIMGNTQLITMDMLEASDIGDHIKESKVIPTGVLDNRIIEVSNTLEDRIQQAKDTVLKMIKEEDEEFYKEVKSDYTKLFGPLPIPPKVAKDFHMGYLIRKYLWSQPGESAYKHLLRYGLSKEYLNDQLPRVPSKFFAIRDLVQKEKKSVVLCSYLDTVDKICQMIEGIGISTIKITGEVPQHKRTNELTQFRESNEQMVAVLSNVGERDLDIPEASLLIVFDLIRTTKTVYQKLKRTRGGTCRVLFYQDTKEGKKVHSVMNNIQEKYSWSTSIEPEENLEFN